MEGDLKKEIKKLQKYRDQIKTWQLNDSMEAAIQPGKLQEHRKMVEEAMECYKDVEKISKMKSYSNQSIMLAAMELIAALSPEAEDAINFLENSIGELENQCETLEEEYEKLSQKKTRKNNSSVIEERKQEMEVFLNRNRFHIDKLRLIIELLKKNKVDPKSVDSIEDHINFYVESNQEPDFIDDESLYDEIMKEAMDTSKRVNNSRASDDDLGEDPRIDKDSKDDTSDSSISKDSSPEKESAMFKSNSINRSQSNTPITPTKLSLNSEVRVSSTQELTSPAIVRNLKPATAPSNPLGAMKWSIAASGAGNASLDLLNGNSKDLSQESSSSIEQNIVGHNVLDTPEKEETRFGAESLDSRNPYYKFVEVLNRSDFSDPEKDLFSDFNLIKLPPGIQDLIISFTATRKVKSSKSKILLNTDSYNAFSAPIQRLFLPRVIRASINQHLSKTGEEKTIEPPLHLLKFQAYWNRIRATDQFERLVNRIQVLSGQKTAENNQIINELTMVLFYGYYYGLTPLENLIAETCLFELEWKPYNSSNELKSVTSVQGRSDSTDKILPTRQYYYWIKCSNLLQSAHIEGGETVEYGDYQVFDLISWDIHLKNGFRLEHRMCQLEPSKVII